MWMWAMWLYWSKKNLQRRSLFHCFETGRMTAAAWLISRIGWGLYVNGPMDQSIYWYFEPDSMRWHRPLLSNGIEL